MLDFTNPCNCLLSIPILQDGIWTKEQWGQPHQEWCRTITQPIKKPTPLEALKNMGYTQQEINQFVADYLKSLNGEPL